MIALDDRLRTLRAHARTWGDQLRSVADEVAADAGAVERLTDLPVFAWLGAAEYVAGTRPLVAGGQEFALDSVLEQVVFFEELARGDLGGLMAAPGAPLAGPLVQVLGDAAQQAWFTGRLHARPTFTYFALTEPDRGSDAGALTTALTACEDGGYRLDGSKRYVGNVSRSQLGVVFARLHPGPLGVRAVLVDSAWPGICAQALPTVGLHGALVGAVDFDAVPVPGDRLLGAHLPATRRGAWGWTRVFNRIRPRVAAFAVGVAAAAHDYVLAQRTALRPDERHAVDELALRIRGVRQLVRRAAVAVDTDPGDAYLASAAKIAAARLAEEVTLTGTELLGPGARLDHPQFDRLVRDARGLEFMEGAGNVQKLIVAHHVTRGRAHGD